MLKIILRHFCKTHIAKFWAVSCELGFEVLKKCAITTWKIVSTKFEYGYQNKAEFYADFAAVGKNLITKDL